MPIADFGLEDKIAIVTGGSRGIGRSIALGLAEHGAHIALAARKPEALEEACEAEGRDVASVEITAMWIPAMEGVDSVARYREMGVERLVVPIPALGGNPLEQLPRFADEVLAKVV